MLSVLFLLFLYHFIALAAKVIFKIIVSIETDNFKHNLVVVYYST